MAELHEHYCRRCNQVYTCTADRPIDASSRGGPSDSVCFHHYGVLHETCIPDHSEKVSTVGGE